MGPALPVEPEGVALWPVGALFRWWGHMGPLVPVSLDGLLASFFKELSFPSDTG